MFIISVSGGLGSTVSCLIAHQFDLEFKMVFADTLIEDPDLYRFLDDIEIAVGQEIVRLKDGRTPWEIFVYKRYIGNTRTAHCSQILKTKQVENWLKNNAALSDPLVLGMDASEQDRIDRASENWHPRRVVSLINQYKIWRPLWPGIFKSYGLIIPSLYETGFPHNNCGGMCVRAGLKQFATLLEEYPLRFAWHEEEMEKTMKNIGPTARPFLRTTENGLTSYITLKKFRELYTKGKLDIDPYDYGGCSCFVD